MHRRGPLPPRENPALWLLALGLLLLIAALIWYFGFYRGKTDRAVVPSVVGLTQDQAIRRLNDRSFRTIVERPADAPAGAHVKSQIPGAGTQLKKHQTVRIQIAQPAPAATTTAATTTAATTTTAAPPAASVVAPDVTGQQQVEAGSTIQALGLGADSYPVPSSEARGTVVSESPAAGTKLKQGDLLRLNVALGPDTPPTAKVPDVTGPVPADARQAARQAGFTVRTVERTAPDAASRGKVILQKPDAGASASGLTQITLYVGR